MALTRKNPKIDFFWASEQSGRTCVNSQARAAIQSRFTVIGDTSDQTWLTLGTISNGVINFSFTANTSNSVRTANITVLGFKIKVRQNGAAPSITSANNATFTVGTAGTFTVTATGSPAPAVSVTGALPMGVTFDTSTNTLSGTPAVGQGRTYNIVFTASNGVGSNASQGFKLTVLEFPAVISLNNTPFTVGVKGSFTVVATGFPAPAVSITGALPSGVTFDPKKGELSGTPAAYTGGVYPIQFTASNGTVPSLQNFILTVNQPPVFTSVPYVLFTATPATFTVTAAGFPAPSLSQTGTLPTGVTFNATTKMLSWTPSTGVAGPYPIQFIASNGVGPNTVQTFTLTVSQAPAFAVNVANGDVTGLIAAINAANARPGPDVINLAAGGTYTLTAVDNTSLYLGPTGLPIITTEITINGNGATIQRSSGGGTPDFRIFQIEGNLTLNGATIRGGRAVQGRQGYIGGGSGLRMDSGNLQIVNSTVTGNGSVAGENPGGGIFNFGGALIVQNSTISGNTSYGGYGGGGIRIMSGTSAIINSTIFENRADATPGQQGRGDAISEGFTSGTSVGGIVKNSILASPTQGIGNDCYGAPLSVGHNIASDSSCGLTGTGALNSTDPLLGPLANNGGPTLTHLPFPGSPVIDAVPLASCTDSSGNPLATDQRGIARPRGAACEIGSVER